MINFKRYDWGYYQVNIGVYQLHNQQITHLFWWLYVRNCSKEYEQKCSDEHECNYSKEHE